MTEYVKLNVGDYVHFGVVVAKTEHFVEFTSNLVGGKFSIPHNDNGLSYITEEEYNVGTLENKQNEEPVVEEVVAPTKPVKQPKTTGKKTVKEQVLEIMQQHPNKTKKELVQIVSTALGVAENTANMYLYKATK